MAALDGKLVAAGGPHGLKSGGYDHIIGRAIGYG